MWWLFVLLALMTLLRILALMHTPAPVENDTAITIVTPKSVWGTGWGSAFDAVMYNYTEPLARTGMLMTAYAAEGMFALLYVVCAYAGWMGMEIAMKVGFVGALVQIALLGHYSGIQWPLLEIFPALAAGLGLATGGSEE